MIARKQSTTTYPVQFLMVDSTDHVTAETGLSPTVTISKNGGAYGAASGAVTEVGNGVYAFAGNASDRDTLGELMIHAEATGADKVDMKVLITSYDPFVDIASILADTGTDGVVLKAAGLNADAVAEIADGVWDEAISGHTTGTTFGGKNQKVVPSETINDYKADVSGLATTAHVQEVENKVDAIDVTTVASMGKIDALDVKVSAIDTDSVMNAVVDGAYTFEQVVQIIAAALAGKLSRAANTLTFRDLSDTLDRIVAETDVNKQRTDMTYTV